MISRIGQFYKAKPCLCYLVGFAAVLQVLSAQAPLVEEKSISESVSSGFFDEWKEDAAERALNSGLVGLAEEMYRELLEETELSAEERAAIQLNLAAALIAQQDFEALRVVLEQIPEANRTDRFALYRAIALYGNGAQVNAEAFREALEQVRAGQLRPAERSWYVLLGGLLADLDGRADALEPAFRRAEAAAVSSQQRAFFKSLVMREKLLRTPASEPLAAEVRRQLDGLNGGSASFAYVREYAIILYNLGRTAEAEQVIARELSNSQADYGREQRDQLLLLRAIIQGSESETGRIALQEIVRSGKSRDMMSIALQLMARSSDRVARAEFSEFLDEIISRANPHPLLGQLVYMRSQLSLVQSQIASERGDVELARDFIKEAENDAQLLLDQFPGLQEIENVYRLFAYAALQRDPPQHRAAADFLIQLRDRGVDDAERNELNRLIGDCYFLKGDYADAVDFYRSAYARSLELGDDDGLLLRLVTAELRSGQIEAALITVDQADFGGRISLIDRWQVEWNVAQALKASGDRAQALQRVRLLLQSSSDAAVPAVLDLRLRWLQARLRMLEGDTEGLAESVDDLLVRVRSFPEGTLDEKNARLLITEALLLKADLLILSGETEAGREALASLREGYPQSAAAERSYLTEAGFYNEVGNLEAAQRTLGVLAEQYPDGQLAPQALFEDALIGEQRGPEHYEDAVRTLDTLANAYPGDPLVFAAKLKQGDLLRLMNRFDAAQIVYENLINRYPDHPQQHIAVLSRADCLLALAKSNETKLDNVSLVLERLMDLPALEVDFQAEAAYKWAFVLQERDLPDEAMDVFASRSLLLLDPENAVQLGQGGRYWVSRAILDLGRLLEESGEAEEARRVYRKILAFNLPGQNLAQSRADRIRISEE